MTLCLGINVREGLVGIADTRITSGNECLTARKLRVYHRDGGAIFIMTSGLRSVTDKALTYFEQALEERDEPFARLYQVVNLLTDQVRKVADEDRAYLERGGLQFNMKALVGGQMSGDPVHKLYLVYPEGNWVDTGRGTPYHIIGSSGYGKPVLVRALHYTDSMRHAFKAACLAFDSTRISAADVDFPLDAVLYSSNTYRIVHHRYYEEDLREISNWWQRHLRLLMADLTGDWVETAFAKLDKSLGSEARDA